MKNIWLRKPLGISGKLKFKRRTWRLDILATKYVNARTKLPEGYSFAVLEGPKDRLAQFEAIGMEPEELRKAAEIYRKIKEVEV